MHTQANVGFEMGCGLHFMVLGISESPELGTPVDVSSVSNLCHTLAPWLNTNVESLFEWILRINCILYGR